MPYCPRCGKEIEASATFCWNCGMKLSITPIEEGKPSQARYCQYCGGELPTDASFCSGCGRPLKPEVRTLIPSTPTEKPSKPSWAWFLLPILLTWLGGIIGYFALRDKDKRMARNVLIVGVVLTAIIVFFAIVGYVIYEVTMPP